MLWRLHVTRGDFTRGVEANHALFGRVRLTLLLSRRDVHRACVRRTIAADGREGANRLSFSS